MVLIPPRQFLKYLPEKGRPHYVRRIFWTSSTRKGKP